MSRKDFARAYITFHGLSVQLMNSQTNNVTFYGNKGCLYLLDHCQEQFFELLVYDNLHLNAFERIR